MKFFSIFPICLALCLVTSGKLSAQSEVVIGYLNTVYLQAEEIAQKLGQNTENETAEDRAQRIQELQELANALSSTAADLEPLIRQELATILRPLSPLETELMNSDIVEIIRESNNTQTAISVVHGELNAAHTCNHGADHLYDAKKSLEDVLNAIESLKNSINRYMKGYENE